MKNVIYNLKDITDSKELLEAKPHPFTTMLIYILIAFLVISIAWSYFGEIDIVIKSNGVVRPNEKVSKIINKIPGKVESINIQDGQKVKKGDVLYTIEYGNLTLEQKTFFDEFKKVKKENDSLSKLRKSIVDNKNCFDNSKEEEKDYYYKYLKYHLDNEKLRLENKQSKITLEQTKNTKSLNQKKLDMQISNTEQEIKHLKKLQESITKSKDLYAKDDSLFKNKFVDYKSSIEKLENTVAQRIIALEVIKEKEKQTSVNYDSELEDGGIAFLNAKTELEKYKNDYIITIVNSIDSNNNTLKDTQYNIKLINNKIDDLTSSQYYREFIINAIKQNTDLFAKNKVQENNIYYRQYKDYNYNLQKLNNAKSVAADIYGQKTLENAKLDLERYKNEYMLNIRKSILDEKTVIADLDASSPKKILIEQLIINLQTLEQSINQDRNLFSLANLEYYNRFLNYKVDVKKLENSIEQIINSYRNSELDNAYTSLEKYKNEFLLSLNNSIKENETTIQELNLNLSKNKNQLSNIEITLKNLSILEESINKGINTFPSNNKEYYSKYIAYSSNISKLKNNVDQCEKTIKDIGVKQKNSIINIKKELEQTEIALKDEKLNMSKFNNESLLNISIEIDKNIKILPTLGVELELNFEDSSLEEINIEYSKTLMSKYEIDTLVSIDENIKVNKSKIEELDKNLKSININIDDCNVKAPMDGVVNIIKDVTVQELLQSGTEIATIIPDNNAKYKVQLYLSNKDIANIRVGDKVKYHFEALPYKEYGELTGTLVKISTDAKVDQQSGNSYYAVESYVENIPLYSYKGKKSELKLGMSCEAQIITKRKKILYYLLEKINLKD
ncbi:HlyD family efflux transporter periplasmic adaptor subunit [Clostridium sp. CS001]|uniref:HlyD family efflux transporter periplasmic adaptor subunit n=1 Tax=Clostridium sp. CS001 TaxID=2880648 RepID=UPI001CF1C203|nr:HlyD family efflux transporter periplasmic adaptor subunit [Clostridium sp. CS001]MCB2291445.1 HlyD family efflux transporter periplasmic adaptor subunit [Clostridium sp. CS001]